MKKLVALVLFCAMTLSSVIAADTDWPEKPITMVVPYAVGGLVDQVNRLMGQYGEKYFGEPIVPTNQTGAGGVVGMTNYLREKPNTTTLIFASPLNFKIAGLFTKLPYKDSDFAPVIGGLTSTFVLVTNPDTGIKTLKDIQKYAKDHKVTVAVNGLTGSEYLMAKPLLVEMGVDGDGVSFNGANESMNATIAGDTTLAVTHASLAKEFVKAGKLVPIVAFDDKPIIDDVYDLKPITDFGYEYFFTIKNTIYIRAGTDPEIIEKAYTQLKALFNDPEFAAKAKKLNVQIDPISPAEIAAYTSTVEEKLKMMYKIIQESK